MHWAVKLSWDDAQTFLAIDSAGSFSGAAKLLGVGQPTVSRRIRHLEALLSQQLFIRGRHGAVPTPVAESLLPAAREMARWAAEFDRTASITEHRAQGRVTIAAPPGVAVEQLAPFAASLRLTEPDIQLEVLSSVAHVDLSRGEADIAIRTAQPNEPELTAVHSAVTRPAVYGAPQYVATLEQPCRWGDLQWISWTGQYRDVFPRPMLERLIPNFEPVFASDDYLVQKAGAIAGLGAFIMNEPSAAEAGLLQRIDVGVTLPETEFHIVCAKSVLLVPRVRSVLALLEKAVVSLHS